MDSVEMAARPLLRIPVKPFTRKSFDLEKDAMVDSTVNAFVVRAFTENPPAMARELLPGLWVIVGYDIVAN